MIEVYWSEPETVEEQEEELTMEQVNALLQNVVV